MDKIKEKIISKIFKFIGILTLLFSNISIMYGQHAINHFTSNQTSYSPSLNNKSSIDTYNNKFNQNDYQLAFQLAIFLYLEYGLERYTRDYSSHTPNNFDLYLRKHMIWNNDDIDKAETISDILLYGAFIGTIPIIPIFSKNRYLDLLRFNLDVLSLNGIITDIVKMTVKRQRPDSYYGTRESNEDSFRSFFSGHTSTAFALATSNAIILTEKYPQNSSIIWTCAISLAAATGYARIAADKHYFTDILCGGITGYSISNILWKKRNNHNAKLSFSGTKNSIRVNLDLQIKS